jgi:hypothetical protein
MKPPSKEHLHAHSSQTAFSMLDSIAAKFLERGASGSIIRRWTLIIAIGLYWSILAFFADEPLLLLARLDQIPFPVDIALNVTSYFFSPSALMHILPIIAGLWLGIRIGSHYLADLYEPGSFSNVNRYLRSALWGLHYETIQIRSNGLDEIDAASPLLRIGGPGYLDIHLGFAAIVESRERQPIIYGAGNRRFIRGFERLRDVVDLRDQLRQIDKIRAVTRDGIEVYARDAQMVFRVYSGAQPRSLTNPYPYTNDALIRLVYNHPVTRDGVQKWDSILPDLVRQEICAFVGSLTLEEFLALQPVPSPASQELLPQKNPAEPRSANGIHIPRRQLTERFHTSAVRRRLRENGLELAWVGVGTWQIHAQRPIEPLSTDPGKTIIATWRDLQRAQAHRSPQYLERYRKHRFNQTCIHLLQTVINTWENDELHGPYRNWALLRVFYEQFDLIGQSLIGGSEVEPPLDYQTMLNHLKSITRSQEMGE